MSVLLYGVGVCPLKKLQTESFYNLLLTTVSRNYLRANLRIRHMHVKFLCMQFLPRDASAERGYEIVCRLSVRLSVRP